MFALPSMWNLIVTTIVFFVSAWYINRYLDKQEMPKGMIHGLLVFLLASVVSWCTGELVAVVLGTQSVVQTTGKADEK
ncbi:MAG TPA: hypothetical protein VEP71_00765 [Gallionella sp.]|nr:hypothetical protein [Gallionella sp.]